MLVLLEELPGGQALFERRILGIPCIGKVIDVGTGLRLGAIGRGVGGEFWGHLKWRRDLGCAFARRREFDFERPRILGPKLNHICLDLGTDPVDLSLEFDYP